MLDLRGSPSTAGAARATDLKQKLAPYRGAGGIPLEEPSDLDDIADELQELSAVSDVTEQQDES